MTMLRFRRPQAVDGYRFYLSPHVVGPVRPTRDEAVEDAAAAGYASWCPQYRTTFLTVPARIEPVIRQP